MFSRLKINIRISIIFTLVLAQSYCTHAQHHIVSNPKQNIIYYGIPNPLQVMVEGYKCNDIIVTTDNGQIEQIGSDCNYIIDATDTGKATIKILSKKSSHKVLGITTLRVHHLPDPQAMIGTKPGGDISRNEMRVHIGLIAMLHGFDIEARYVITKYVVTIFRKGKIYYLKNCDNARFPTDVKDEFEKIEVGDSILFSEIKCKAPDSRLLDLQPLEFTIIE